MKVLFVIGTPLPFAGAGWTRIDFFAESWAKEGNEVDVLGAFSPKTIGQRGSKVLGNKRVYNVIPVISSKLPFVVIANFSLSYFVSIFFLLAKRPKTVIISLPPGEVGLGVLLACKFTRITHTVDYRDEWEDYTISLAETKRQKTFHRMIKRFGGYLFSTADVLATVTPNCKASLQKRGIKYVELIENGADIDVFKPIIKKTENAPFKLFYSGGIGSYYRLDVVLKAFKRFLDSGPKDAVLFIAGGGDVNNLLGMAEQLEISKNVQFLGSVTEKSKLSELIAESDLGLIPYDDNPLWNNALPAKFFEYCACGLPVIATVTQDSILGRLILDNRLGSISPPLDDVQLANAITELYVNSEFKKDASKRARRLIVEHYDRKSISQNYLAIIKAAADGAGK